MRAITVRQPHAWAIIHGGKDVENRTRNIAGAYRGLVAIHASKANDLGAWAALAETNLPAWGRAMDARGALFGGVILGVVDLVDVHLSKRSTTASHLGDPVCFDDTTPTGRLCSPWAQPDHQHLILRNPRPLPEPIPYRGALGLWTLPDDVLGGAS